MTRRASGQRGQVVPGLSDAYATYRRRFADRWATPGNGAAEAASAAERGEPVDIDGEIVWRALHAVQPRLADRFLDDTGRYRLTWPDMLERIEGEDGPAVPVFWPGDGTSNLYTGSKSVRNYRRPDGSMVLAEDEQRVARDGTQYTPTDAA